MNKFTQLLAVTTAAFSIASSASALTLVQIAVSGEPGANQISWDGSNGGEGTVTVTALDTFINFDNSLYNDGAGLDAVLTLVASTDGGGTLDTALPNFTQRGINGYFEFRSTDLSTVYLRGDFTNFWLTGITGDFSGNLTSVGGQLNLSSDLVNLSRVHHDNAILGFVSISPPYSIANGNTPNARLNDFTASNLTGSFGGAVPEPGTWALMIMGFGGAGAMLRSRRKAAVAA